MKNLINVPSWIKEAKTEARNAVKEISHTDLDFAKFVQRGACALESMKKLNHEINR